MARQVGWSQSKNNNINIFVVNTWNNKDGLIVNIHRHLKIYSYCIFGMKSNCQRNYIFKISPKQLNHIRQSLLALKDHLMLTTRKTLYLGMLWNSGYDYFSFFIWFLLFFIPPFALGKQAGQCKTDITHKYWPLIFANAILFSNIPVPVNQANTNVQQMSQCFP